MSHYDCDNCGEPMGCHYGTCPSCTPSIVFKLKEKLDLAEVEAKQKFYKINAERIKYWEEEKQKFIDDKTRNIRKRYKIEYNKGLKR